MDIDKPTLGVRADLEKIEYPVLVTLKIDGIRCIKTARDVKTRTMTTLPNKAVRATLKAILPDGMDGELVCGDFENTSSVMLSPSNTGKWQYLIFDYVKWSFMRPYESRVKDLKEWYAGLAPEHKQYIQILTPVTINKEEDLLAYYEMALKDGYEGLILRKASGKYKRGRSTLKEGILLKLKPRDDMEGKVIAAKSIKGDGSRLGSFLVELPNGKRFSLGTGFTDAQKLVFWKRFCLYKGKMVTFNYSGFTNDGKPKHASFKAFRAEMDGAENFPGFFERMREYFGLNRKASHKSFRLTT